MLYGATKYKYDVAFDIVQKGGDEFVQQIHGNEDGVIMTPKADYVYAWFTEYINDIGDVMPDSANVHLSIYQRWIDIFNIYDSEMKAQHGAEVQRLSYTQFRNMIKSDFSYVKRPKVTHLAKCAVCAELATHRMRCRDEHERSELKVRIATHTALHKAERRTYHIRRQQATSHPDPGHYCQPQ